MQFERHCLVYLDPEQWQDIIGDYPAAADLPVVVAWASLHRPLISRRPVCADTGQKVGLGLPLPPSLGKQRIAIEAPPKAIASTSAPPLLSVAIHSSPDYWKPVLEALIALAPQTRCFGSLAWQSLTGLDYLSSTSDLDLLWNLDNAGEADSLLPTLAAIQAEAPMRLDGEFVAPNGMAVQWREWASGSSEILAKTVAGVNMVTREALFS